MLAKQLPVANYKLLHTLNMANEQVNKLIQK